MQGPFTSKPKITTGAGDHFNSGFLFGQTSRFPERLCLLTGVTPADSMFVTGQSPAITDLCQMLREWPE